LQVLRLRLHLHLREFVVHWEPQSPKLLAELRVLRLRLPLRRGREGQSKDVFLSRLDLVDRLALRLSKLGLQDPLQRIEVKWREHLEMQWGHLLLE
jgi:hypothetical protein